MSDAVQWWERLIRNEDGTYDYAVSFDMGQTWDEKPLPEWARRYTGDSVGMVRYSPIDPKSIFQ
jgi:hypothetical protein